MVKFNSLIYAFCLHLLVVANSFSQPLKTLTSVVHGNKSDPEFIFRNPPEDAKPGVLWMWMGSNVSKDGITKDLVALKQNGFNKATMYSLADITTPWNREIIGSPTPQVIAWTEPWWALVRYAATEAKRLGIEFGMHNCPGYESSGGIWITPELSMQELCWSVSDTIKTGDTLSNLNRPVVDPRAKLVWPIFNPATGLVENPETEARKTYYKDVAVLALPSTGIISKDQVIDLTKEMDKDGHLNWIAPPGIWLVYRFGHTTTGTVITPAQWKATGLECDKMSKEAVSFHMDHVVNEIKTHIGDLVGNGFTHVLFDSYEAGVPTWTPKMPQEFLDRRGYDLRSYLPVFAGRVIGGKADTAKFRNDFDETVKDLYRDNYFKVIQEKLHAANLKFACEPYGGPWRQEDVLPTIDNVMTEFWTSSSIDNPFLKITIAAQRKSGKEVIEAEAFTGLPDSSKWNETPHWLKTFGDEAFCAGVNRLLLHRFVHQPFSDQYKPGLAMGQWGTHFDRTQTWWKQSTGIVTYWQRCEALLQWGSVVLDSLDDFTIVTPDEHVEVNYIHRNQGRTQIYFLANKAHKAGVVRCKFKVTGLQPERWDAVTGEMKSVLQFTSDSIFTNVDLPFEDAQSCFIVFRKAVKNLANTRKISLGKNREILKITAPWKVQFFKASSRSSQSVTFESLEDWTKNPNKNIRYFSGTAKYTTTFNLLNYKLPTNGLFVDLGMVHHVARVKLNGRELGLVWTAPWEIEIPAGLLKTMNNKLEVEVTNIWANRLIGDEQEKPDMEWLPGHIWGGQFLKAFPDWFLNHKSRTSKGRHCFTTWNYFTKDSPLVPSGLVGPVRIIKH
jgi:alpha-L-rhamnosidase